jgi:hypothetical protein
LEAYKTSNDKEIATLKSVNETQSVDISAAQADATKALADIATVDTALKALVTDVNTNSDNIGTIIGRLDNVESSVGGHSTKIGVIEGKVNALVEEDAKINEALGTVEGKITAEADARAKEDAKLAALISANTENIATINSTIGVVPTGKTIIKLIEEAKTEASYDDTGIKGLITSEENRAKAEEERIVALITAETSRADTAEKANAAEIARVNAVLQAAIENEDGKALDSIKELAVWVEEHETEVLPIIQAHTTAI